MRPWLLFFLLAAGQARATGTLTLDEYLQDVQAHNPDARATIETIDSYRGRLDEGEIPLMTTFYSSFNERDDKTPQAKPQIMGPETHSTDLRLGFTKQTEFGLGANLYFDSQRTVISNASPAYIPVNDYNASTMVLSLTQSLWRNGFGEFTRAQEQMTRANNEAALLQNKFKLKSILLNARNLYWSVVSYNQIVKLQQENVERAKRLRDHMAQRTRMKLYEDTDAMQAEASYQSRELELESSLDDRAAAIRQFNTIRGLDRDTVQELEELPTGEMMQEVEKTPAGKMSREDFEMLRAQARAVKAQAKGANSQINPQLDLTASFATNGRDGLTSVSYNQTETLDKYPTWSVGVMFSVPLDFWTVHDVRHGYQAAGRSADDLDSQAVFSQTRTWDDLVKQKHEAQGRYERSVGIEKIQTQLVKREHIRLINGRATTFEALNLEQGLALAQIQRVRSQLALMQIHNAVKTFEAKK
jgi:outer membrane protein TolC